MIKIIALALLPLALTAAAPKKPKAAKISKAALVLPPLPIAVPAAVAADPANRWTIDLTNGGRVVIQMRPDLAPAHVQRIQQLTRQGFYNGLTFHRVIPGFMAQSGDPRGTGEGGSPLPDLKAEFNDLPHLRGMLSMARSESPDSANSQFFIMLSSDMKLNHKYTAFGRVISGMDAVDRIAVGEPPETPTRIVAAHIGDEAPSPRSNAPVAAPAPVPLPPPPPKR